MTKGLPECEKRIESKLHPDINYCSGMEPYSCERTFRDQGCPLGKKLICKTCGNENGKPQEDNGLSCGIHCDPCFGEMVRKARRRSW